MSHVGQSFVVLVLDFFVVIPFRGDSFTASKFTAADADVLHLFDAVGRGAYGGDMKAKKGEKYQSNAPVCVPPVWR